MNASQSSYSVGNPGVGIGVVRSLHGLVEAQAERKPEATAILAPSREPLSYGQLHIQVKDTVKALRALGIKSEVCGSTYASPGRAVAGLRR